MPKLTPKGQETLRILEEAEKSGKITPKGSTVLNSLRGVGGVSSKEEIVKSPNRMYEALRLPQQFLSQVANPSQDMTTLPPDISPSVLKTLATGTPRVIEETGRTVGKAIEKLNPPIPEGTTSGVFYQPQDIANSVSRGALLTMGALKGIQLARPALSAARQGVLSFLEKPSGISPKQAGALEAGYKNPKLFFSKGSKAASKFYEAAKNPEANLFEGMTSNKEIVDKAQEVLKAGGKLEPTEAHTARKAVDYLMSKKDAVKDTLVPLRKTLNLIAKESSDISKGDVAFEQGLKAEAIRRLFPTNIGGTFSSWRTAGAAALAALGAPGKVLAPILFSPAVQGATATAMGAASKLATPLVNNPAVSGAVASVISEKLKEPKPTKAEAKEYKKRAKRENPDLEGDALSQKAREMWKADKLGKK